MKIQKKKKNLEGGLVGGGGQVRGRGWGQGGCEWRSEAFVKIKKIFFWGVRFGGGGGVSVDVNGGVKLL